MMQLSVVLLLMVSASYGAETPSTASPKHYTNLIVGGGPAGLYTAWRLSAERAKNETTAVFEWSKSRLGGRVFTKKFSGGQYLELGAMRYTDEHLLLKQVIKELNLTSSIRNFSLTDNSLYHLRGKHMFKEDIKKKGAPYFTEYNRTAPGEIFELVLASMNIQKPKNRKEWCKFIDEAKFPPSVRSTAFTKNDYLGNIGYWNLLMDQLEDEGLAYAADASGFASSVLNSNAAYTILLNAHSSKYSHLRMGYTEMIDALERESEEKNVKIEKGQRMMEFYWNATENKFYATFQNCSNNDTEYTVTSDRLFLCVPQRSLEMIRETDVIGEWKDKQKRVLKHSQGLFFMNSVIPAPAYKVALLYKEPWWLNATYKPSFYESASHETLRAKNHGPAITDLPLRNVYYFGNNGENNNGQDPKYGILASYDDMENAYFWAVLETPANQTLRMLAPADAQALADGGNITPVMHKMLRDQLNQVHFDSDEMQVPEAEEGWFMNWGRDPYGAGYHTWKAHYKIAEVQNVMTRPSESVGEDVPLHVAGETYAFDQRWIEGAFTTAEAILVDMYGLKPLLQDPENEYPLICPRPKKETT